MYRGNDFIPRQSTHDRAEVAELIRDRVCPADVSGAASDGLMPPRLPDDAAPVTGVHRERPDARPRRRGGLVMLALTVFAALLLIALGLLLVMPLGWREQAIVGALLIAGALALSSASRAPTMTMALLAVSLFATLRYAYWRVVQTWDGLTGAVQVHQWDVLVVLLLLAAECYVFATLALGYFQTVRPLRRPAAPLAGSSSQWPTVDVLIPTFNERLEDVRATVLGALALEYPEGRFNVFLLDDGGRREFRQFARAVGACYLASDYQTHSKADQINEALARTSGELVAIFDCDQVPTRSFLQMTVGWFQRDRRLGLVQTPHHFYSPDPFERNLDQYHKVPSEAALFHRLVQDGNDLWNASLCCGSCAVHRREALDDIGGIAVDTVTEDAHTAVRMQRRGWSTAYLNVPQAAGPATGSLSGYITQRGRWAHGVMQILRLENP
jgi:cellulose synthase (UDP-forming)